MPISVQCGCGKSFAVKEELAGKAVKCPACQKPVSIPAAAAQAKGKHLASAAGTGQAAGPTSLLDEVGLRALAPGARPCPGCGAPLAAEAVLCIECGYNVKLGRRIQTLKVGTGEGHGGHGAVATDLLEKAAQVLEEDALEEKKKTSAGVPWWVYLIALIALVSFAAWMLMRGGEEKPEGGSTHWPWPAAGLWV
jgi:hypothetical protein